MQQCRYCYYARVLVDRTKQYKHDGGGWLRRGQISSLSLLDTMDRAYFSLCTVCFQLGPKRGGLSKLVKKTQWKALYHRTKRQSQRNNAMKQLLKAKEKCQKNEYPALLPSHPPAWSVQQVADSSVPRLGSSVTSEYTQLTHSWRSHGHRRVQWTNLCSLYVFNGVLREVDVSKRGEKNTTEGLV